MQVTNHYDLKVPYYTDPPEGFSRYATGAIRSLLYNKPDPGIVKIDDQFSEDTAYIQTAEHAYWEE